MIAADLVNELESRFRCMQGSYRYKCQTGEPYVRIGFELDHPVYRPDGEPQPGVIRPTAPGRFYQTEDEACHAALAAFNAYEADWRARHPGAHPTLYWRYGEDHCFWYPDDGNGKRGPAGMRGRLKVRLVLSNLPVVDVPDADYDARRTAELKREILGGADV